MDSDTEMSEADAMSEVDSLASTVPSSIQSEYDVEEILYERDAEDGPGQEFLVKWTDYELHRAEFVPRENFNARIILRNWERKKRDIAAGLVAPFDIEAWRADQDRIAEETEARREARRAKRAERAARRLALLDHPGNDNTEDVGVNENTRPLEEANPDGEVNPPADEAQPTRGVQQGRRMSIASDTCSSLFVSDESSDETRPKRRRLLSGGRKDTSLLGPYNPEAPTSASDIPSGTHNHQRQLEQELQEQVDRQPKRTRRSLDQRKPPQQQGQPQQPPRSNPQSPPLTSTASLSKPHLSGFGVRPSQTARPNRPRRREREPDVRKLKLLMPSEYPAREGGADSSLYSTIRSPDDIQSPPEARDNTSGVVPVASTESTPASPQLPSKGPRGSNAPPLMKTVQSPKEQDGSSGPPALNLELSRPSSSAKPLSSSDPRMRPSERSHRPSEGSSELSSARAMPRPGGTQSPTAAAKPGNPVDSDQRSPQGPSTGRPHTTSASGSLPTAGVSAPQGLQSSSVPGDVAPSKDLTPAQKEVQKATTDTATISPRYPEAQKEAGKPQEASRSSLRRAPTSQSLSSRSPPRAPRSDSGSHGAGLPERRERSPELPSARRRSPPREPRAVEARRYGRSSDSSVDRESPIGQSGGDSYRPSTHRASESRRGHDRYRPSPSPPSPDLSRSRVPPHWNSYTPAAHSEDMPPRVEKECHSVRQRSAPPSNKPPPKATLEDAEAQIARMPIGAHRPGCPKTTEGYWWNWGEVFVHLSFGPERKKVGPVRLCGMTEVAKGDLLASKGPGRTFEMWFKDLCTAEEYSFLCDQAVENSPRGNAWIEGFEDTNPALFYMAEEFREQNLIAIYRPAKAKGYVWLAYSRKSPCFDFLNWNTGRTPAGVPIYLAVRSSLPPMSVLRLREQEEPARARREFPENVHFRGGESESRWSPEARPDGRARRLSIPAIDRVRMPPQLPKPTQPLSGNPTLQSPEAISPATRDPNGLANRKSSEGGPSATATTDSRLRRRPSLPATMPPGDYVRPSRRSLVEGHVHAGGSDPSRAKTPSTTNVKRPEEVAGPRHPDAMDLTPDFQAHSGSPQLQQEVAALIPVSAVNGTKMIMEFFEKTVKMTVKELACLEPGNEDATTDNFYLHFPLDQEEAKAEYQLIEAWLKAHDVMVWTDWAKFRKNCKCGVVIFHESFLAYWSMRPAIRDALWASRPINFWKVRISRPLESPDDRFCEPGSHFQRLFRSGHAYLVTEDVFTDLRRTAMIICWFYGFQKNRPGFHKLFLRPDVIDYLNRRLEDPRHDKKDDHLLLSILYWIVKANSVSMRFPHFAPESLNPAKLDNANNNVLCLPIPKYGSRTEADNPEIPRDLTQVERDADHLVEAFSGFTILNAARFRKTIVITSMKNPPLIQRWQSWGHVAIYSVNKFFEYFRLDEKVLQERIQNVGNGGRPGQKDGTLSGAQTPKTPVDPRTPKAPWDGSTSESSNPAQAQQRASLRHKYPAPYK